MVAKRCLHNVFSSCNTVIRKRIQPFAFTEPHECEEYRMFAELGGTKWKKVELFQTILDKVLTRQTSPSQIPSVQLESKT